MKLSNHVLCTDNVSEKFQITLLLILAAPKKSRAVNLINITSHWETCSQYNGMVREGVHAGELDIIVS